MTFLHPFIHFRDSSKVTTTLTSSRISLCSRTHLGRIISTKHITINIKTSKALISPTAMSSPLHRIKMKCRTTEAINTAIQLGTALRLTKVVTSKTVAANIRRKSLRARIRTQHRTDSWLKFATSQTRMGTGPKATTSPHHHQVSVYLQFLLEREFVASQHGTKPQG